MKMYICHTCLKTTQTDAPYKNQFRVRLGQDYYCDIVVRTTGHGNRMKGICLECLTKVLQGEIVLTDYREIIKHKQPVQYAPAIRQGNEDGDDNQ